MIEPFETAYCYWLAFWKCLSEPGPALTSAIKLLLRQKK